MQRSAKPFRQALADLIAASGLEQLELAVRSDVSESAISLYLSGRREPRVESIRKIARGLDVEPEYFLEFRQARVKRMADEAVREGILEPEDLAAYLDIQRELRKAGA